MTSALFDWFSRINFVKIVCTITLFVVGLLLMIYGTREVDYHKYTGAFSIFVIGGLALWFFGAGLLEKGIKTTLFRYLVILLGNNVIVWAFWYWISQLYRPADGIWIVVFIWMIPFTVFNVFVWCAWGPKEKTQDKSG